MIDVYHEHPFVNGFICLTLLGSSLVLDFVGITAAHLDFALGLIVKLAQIGLGIIGAVNFYWALKKRK